MKDNIKPGKIDGVLIKELKVWKDKPDLEQDIEPGIFMEVLRDDAAAVAEPSAPGRCRVDAATHERWQRACARLAAAPLACH